mgnify:FL=1
MNAASSARLPPIPPITHGSVKPDGLTISLTAKDVAVGGNQRNLASKRGQIGDYESGGSFDFNNEILDTKISSLAILNQQTSRLMGLLRYR